MPTAQKLINSAVGKLGGVTPNTDVSANESADGLVVLNSMLDSWRIERLNVYQILQTPHTWPASTTSRTIGAGGNFNVECPVKIESAFSLDSNNITLSITVLERREQYDWIPDKTSTSTTPQYLFYDQSYPIAALYMWPVPNAAFTLLLNTWRALQSFTALTTNLLLPPGYQFAIENNLAMALSPYYPNATAVQFIAPLARSSKAAIQRANATIGTLSLPLGIAGRGRFDITIGGYR